MHAAIAWDAVTGRERFTTRHDGGITDVAWNPDSEHLAVSDTGGLVTIVDRSGDQVTVLREEPEYGVNAIALSPDGRLLAAVRNGEPYIRIGDWRRAEIVHIVETFAQSVAFDPSGTRLVSTHPGGLAEVWDVESWELVTTFHGHSGRVMEPDFAPDGALVATAGNDGAVPLWDPESGTDHGGPPRHASALVCSGSHYAGAQGPHAASVRPASACAALRAAQTSTPGSQLALDVVFDYHPFVVCDRDGATLTLEADHRAHAHIELVIRDLSRQRDSVGCRVCAGHPRWRCCAVRMRAVGR